MPVPSPRNSIRIARGNYADLLSNITEIGEGELCFALDQDKFYSKAGGSLVAVGGGTELYSIAQLGDVDVTGAVNGQVLVYDATEDKWVPADQSGGGGGEVDSVNGQTGVVVLDASDVGAPSSSEFSVLEGRVQANEVAQGNNIAKNNEQDGRLDSLESDVSNIDTFSGDYNDLSNKPSIPSNLDDLVDVNAPSPSSGQFLQWSGSEWTPGAASGAPVDSVNGQTGAVVLDADDISDAATTNKYATQAELDKLAGIEANAQVNTVSSVNTQTGDVVLTSSDVGLGNVDNTSDADKPISTATQAALGSKADLINGVVPNSQLPSIAITEYLGEAADETAMLALDGQKGDWCIRTDTSSTWVVTGDDAAELASWTELATPASAVTSVNGYTGTVVLSASDVGAAPSTIDLQAVTDNGNTTTNGATFAGGDYTIAAGGQCTNSQGFQAGGNPAAGEAGSSLGETGKILATSASNAAGLEIRQTGGTAVTASIEGSGSASFAGGLVTLNADGSATFSAEIAFGGAWGFPGSIPVGRLGGGNGLTFIGGDTVTDGVALYDNSFDIANKTVSIQTDGSASFAGGVGVGNVTQVKIQDTGIYLKDTGSAGSASHNISLDTNGSASFAGGIQSLNYRVNNSSGAQIGAYSTGQYFDKSSAVDTDLVIAAQGNNPSLHLFNASNDTDPIIFGYDGSASFDSTVVIAPDNGRQIELANSPDGGVIYLRDDGQNTKITLGGNDGRATFAGTVNTSENTITGTWDLSAGNFWTCGAITIPNPTNATTGTSGLIRLTAAPTGWGANIKHPGGSAETISSFPAVVPFYVQSSSVILLGKATQGIA